MLRLCGATLRPIMHERWMHRCLELATLGAGHVAPNPLVGSVLVQGERVLAEGWHHQHGGPHAEVNCLATWPGSIPEDAVLYVNLEPCAHHGRTPPCADLVVARGLKRVVVGMQDPFPAVSGQGIARMRAAGIDVTVGIAEHDCRWLNRRFLTSVEEQRPYIVLKWARSRDGLLDQRPRRERLVQRISSPATDVLVHRWRSEEQAILVGSRTVVNDDPQLTVRHVPGRQPLRVVIDRDGITPDASRVFDQAAPTLLFTAAPRPALAVEQYILGPVDDPLDHLLHELHRRNIRSVLVEGGAELLRHFITRGLWDEARIIEGEVLFGAGTPAPDAPSPSRCTVMNGQDRITLHLAEGPFTYYQHPSIAWPW